MRLRDCGRTQWWALGVMLLEITPFVVAGLFAGQSFAYVMTHQGVDESGHRSWPFGAAVAVAIVIQFVFTVWLGSLKGQEENRAKTVTATSEPSIWEARSWEDEDKDEEPRSQVVVSAPRVTVHADHAQRAVRHGRPAFGRRTA
jgi:hypothetical protein